MNRFLLSAAIITGVHLLIGAHSTAQAQDPYWLLIHDRHMLNELKLTGAQRQALHKATDELDLQFMALQGQPPEQAAEKLRGLSAEARERLQKVFLPEQHRRINEVTLRLIGTACLLREDVAKKLELTPEQRPKLKQIIGEAKQAQAALDKQVQNGQGEGVAKERQRVQEDEWRKIGEVLTKSQQDRWRELVGPPIDASKLGTYALKAPELASSKEWLNSQPLQLTRLRGQVVVLHFYAFGCINCVRNYGHYRAWQEAFARRGVVLIGVHTPETSGERSVETAFKKAQEEKLVFPIVIDNEKQNWNAWGVSMWPTVFLIDKHGYVRYWWLGELNWQGREGEKLMRQRIEELLAE